MRRIVTLALSTLFSFWAVHGKAQETTDFTVKLESYERQFTKRDSGFVLGDVRLQPSVRYEEQPSYGAALVNPGSFDDTEEAQLEAYFEDNPLMSFALSRAKRQLKKNGSDGPHDPFGVLSSKLDDNTYKAGFKCQFIKLMDCFRKRK